MYAADEGEANVMAAAETDLDPSLAELSPQVAAIARRAGAAIMGYYRGDMAVGHKADDSPITAADREAERIISADLQAMTPDIPIVAEEHIANHGVPRDLPSTFWLVDPLDGTKEFIQSRDEFTVNIALVAGGVPRLGVVLAPALDWLYTGQSGRGAQFASGGEVQPIAVRPAPAAGLTVVASRSHSDATALDAFLADYTVAERKAIGSSLKICLVASGAADLYPRLGPTMEWDTGAAHAVLLAAGGAVLTRDGQPLGYGKPNFENPHFVAVGGQVGL